MSVRLEERKNPKAAVNLTISLPPDLVQEAMDRLGIDLEFDTDGFQLAALAFMVALDEERLRSRDKWRYQMFEAAMHHARDAYALGRTGGPMRRG